MNLPHLPPSSWPGRRCSTLYVPMCTCTCFLFLLLAVPEVPGGADRPLRGEKMSLAWESLTVPWLAKRGRAKVPSSCDCCCHYSRRKYLCPELNLEWSWSCGWSQDRRDRQGELVAKGRASRYWLLFLIFLKGRHWAPQPPRWLERPGCLEPSVILLQFPAGLSIYSSVPNQWYHYVAVPSMRRVKRYRPKGPPSLSQL